MKKILITGFDPFDHAAINPAYEAVKLVPDTIDGVEIIKAEIPTVAYKGIDKVVELIGEHQPDVVLNVGQAGGRFNLTPEKVAINLNDFRIKDNEGNQPLDCPIYEDAPNAYFTTLPIKAMVAAIKKVGVPSTVSYSAGSFVCNQVMYGVLHHIAVNKLPIKAGFIHVPYMTEQTLEMKNQPSLSLQQLGTGLTASIEAIINNETDINEVSGEIC